MKKECNECEVIFDFKMSQVKTKKGILKEKIDTIYTKEREWTKDRILKIFHINVYEVWDSKIKCIKCPICDEINELDERKIKFIGIEKERDYHSYI